MSDVKPLTAYQRRVLRAIVEHHDEHNRAGSSGEITRRVYADAPWVKTWAGRNGSVGNAAHVLASARLIRWSMTGYADLFEPTPLGASYLEATDE